MAHRVVGIEFDHRSGGPQGLVVASGSKQDRRQIRPVGQWVELLGAGQHLHCLVVPLQGGEHMAVEVVDVPATGIQLQRPLELQLRAGPIEVTGVLEERQQAMRFPQPAVELERLRHRLSGPLIGLLRLQRPGSMPEPELRVRHAQSCMREGVARVLHDCQLEVLDALADPLLGEAEEAMAPLEIELVGLEIGGGPPADLGSLIRGQLGLERPRYPQRHVALDHEDIGELPVIRLGPEVAVGLGVDELGDDTHAISGAPNAPLEHRRDLQPGRDLPQALLPFLQRHTRGARDHLEGADLRQLGDDVLRDPVGEVRVLRVRAQVGERQHRDGPGSSADRCRLGERLRERRGRREPVDRLGGERLPQSLLHARGDGGPEPPHARHRVGQPLGHHRLRRGSGVGRLSSEQLVQDAAQTVHVAPGVERSVAQGLLRAHVLGGPYPNAPVREPLAAPTAAHRQGDPEVRDHRLAFMEQDVLRLDIPMDHAVRVRVVEGRGGVPSDADRLLDWKQLLAVEPLAQGFALHVRHHVEEEPIRLARVVQREDVGVIQLGDDLDLAEKPVGSDGGCQLGPEDLHRDLAVVLHVVGQIDRRHAAAPELPLDSVAAG